MDVERKASGMRQLNFDVVASTPPKPGPCYRHMHSQRLLSHLSLDLELTLSFHVVLSRTIASI